MYWRDLEHRAVGWMVICRARLPADIPSILLQETCDLPVLTAFVTLPSQCLQGCCGNVLDHWSKTLPLPGKVFNGKAQSRRVSTQNLSYIVIIGYSKWKVLMAYLTEWLYHLGLVFAGSIPHGSGTLMSHQPCCGVLSITSFFCFVFNQFCIMFSNFSKYRGLLGSDVDFSPIFCKVN